MGITDKLRFGRVCAQEYNALKSPLPFSQETALYNACNGNQALLADIHSEHPRVAEGLVAEITAAREQGVELEVIELPSEWKTPGTAGYVVHDRKCASSDCPIKDGVLDLSDLREAMHSRKADPALNADRAPSQIWSNALRALTAQRVAPKIAATLEVGVEWINNTDDITLDELSELTNVAEKLNPALRKQLDRLKAEPAATRTQTAGERTEAPEAPSVADQAVTAAQLRWCAEHEAEFPRPVKPIKVQSAMTGRVREVHVGIDTATTPPTVSVIERAEDGTLHQVPATASMETTDMPTMNVVEPYPFDHNPETGEKYGFHSHDVGEPCNERCNTTDDPTKVTADLDVERNAFNEAAEQEAKQEIPSPIDLPVSMADASELPAGCTQKDADHVKGYVTCPACLQATWTEVCTEVATININGMGLDSFRKLVTLTNKMLYTAQSRAELQGHVLLPADLDLPF